MGFLSKSARSGLTNNLVKKGVPSGIAHLMAELSYPGGEHSSKVSDLSWNPEKAAYYTNGYLYEGHIPTFMDALQGILPEDSNIEIKFPEKYILLGSKLPEWYILLIRAAEFDESSAILLEYYNSTIESME